MSFDEECVVLKQMSTTIHPAEKLSDKTLQTGTAGLEVHAHKNTQTQTEWIDCYIGTENLVAAVIHAEVS